MFFCMQVGTDFKCSDCSIEILQEVLCKSMAKDGVDFCFSELKISQVILGDQCFKCRISGKCRMS